MGYIQEQANQAFKGSQSFVHTMDDELATKVLESYKQFSVKLDQDTHALLNAIQAKRDAGEDVPLAWLLEQQKYRTIQQQIQSHTKELHDILNSQLPGIKQKAVELSGDALKDLGLGFSHMSKDQVAQIVANVSHSHGAQTPIQKMLQQAPPVVADKIRQALTHHVLVGRSVEHTAKAIRETGAFSAHAAIRIARTETMQAYNDGAIANYRQNADLIHGWEWLVAPDEKVCPYCASHAGKVYDLSVPFSTHPNCRCASSPSLDEVGIKAADKRPEWLKPLAEDDQFTGDNILGCRWVMPGERSRTRG